MAEETYRKLVEAVLTIISAIVSVAKFFKKG